VRPRTNPYANPTTLWPRVIAAAAKVARVSGAPAPIVGATGKVRDEVFEPVAACGLAFSTVSVLERTSNNRWRGP
jgi:hypothetical protein